MLDFSVREFMNAVAEELAEQGTSSRDLLALRFESEALKVLVRPQPHPATYPPLEYILGMVCTACEQNGIALNDLEWLTFFDAEINLQFSGLEGEAVYTFPIESATVH
jgi:hypothetical protein